MSEVLRAVRHYQNDIERCGHDENRVKCFLQMHCSFLYLREIFMWHLPCHFFWPLSWIKIRWCHLTKCAKNNGRFSSNHLRWSIFLESWHFVDSTATNHIIPTDNIVKAFPNISVQETQVGSGTHLYDNKTNANKIMQYFIMCVVNLS